LSSKKFPGAARDWSDSLRRIALCDPIHRFGNEEQKKNSFSLRAEKDRLYALTEPQAGSNAAALQTRALKGDSTLSTEPRRGSPMAGGRRGDRHVILTRRRAKRITAIGSRKARPDQGGKEEKSWGLMPRLCELVFTDCEVPAVIGSVIRGRYKCTSTLDGGASVSVRSSGMRKVRSKRRWPGQGANAFGHPISQFQLFIHARGYIHRNDAARLWSARLLGSGHRSRSAWMRRSPNFASEMATRVTHKAIQIHAATVTAANIPWNGLIATLASRKSTKAERNTAAVISSGSEGEPRSILKTCWNWMRSCLRPCSPEILSALPRGLQFV